MASGNERKDVRSSEAPQMTSKSSEPMKDGVKFVNDTMDLVENIVVSLISFLNIPKFGKDQFLK